MGATLPRLRFAGPSLKLDARNYQRGSRRWRGPPPPLPRPPPPPNPPPPPGPRPPPPPAGFGRASLTFKARPPTFAPFNAVIARSASSVSVISTNANPRDRPVSRSVIRLTRSTVPYASNSERTVSSVAPKSKFPTNMFFKVFSLRVESGDKRRRGHHEPGLAGQSNANISVSPQRFAGKS